MEKMSVSNGLEYLLNNFDKCEPLWKKHLSWALDIDHVFHYGDGLVLVYRMRTISVSMWLEDMLEPETFGVYNAPIFAYDFPKKTLLDTFVNKYYEKRYGGLFEYFAKTEPVVVLNQHNNQVEDEFIKRLQRQRKIREVIK